jgi:soluble lytic murein transglycosylase
MAAAVERVALRARRDTATARELWRLAYLHHRSGRYEFSHNVARRRISGRPWAHPTRGRLVRWSLAWPAPFFDLVRDAVRAEFRQNNEDRKKDDQIVVHPALPSAIMREESSFIPAIESYAGALGLMQLMPATARFHDDDIDGEATDEKLRTPETNVRVGVDHLFWLAKLLDNHPVVIAVAYNAGIGNARKWLRRYDHDDIALWVESVPYLQARDYSKRVIGSYAAYQWLFGARDLDPRPAQSPPDP